MPAALRNSRLAVLSSASAKSALLGEQTIGADTTRPSLYDRLGGIYAKAPMVDNFIDRIMRGERTFLT
jgi:hypothetical protein